MIWTTSYADHGKKDWYIGPALNKYRNYTIFLPGTRGTRDSNRVDFSPTKCRLPDSDSADRLSAALEDLKHELSPTARNPAVDADHGTPLNKAIRKLKELFGPIAEKASQTITDLLPGAVPRVVNPPASAPTTSTRPPSLKEATN